jgi:triphosphoribosyl-dephospho-CoA synthase
MNAQSTAGHIEAAFLWACELDVACAKPGNVSVARPGHRMTADLFLASAHASCRALARHEAPVGARIEEAIARTREVAGCNTNLGIVLLCAPLATAFEALAPKAAGSDDALRAALQNTLARLTIEDASAAYRAIALANPGGLGEAPDQNVGTSPTIDLRAAMTLASARDSVARQYANNFDDVLGFGIGQLRAALVAFDPHAKPGSALATAVLATWLDFLTRWPDSHIARKHGLERAQLVTHEAAAWRTQARRADGTFDPHAIDSWDAVLKADGINPGTSADLVVATLFAAACLNPELMRLPLPRTADGRLGQPGTLCTACGVQTKPPHAMSLSAVSASDAG